MSATIIMFPIAAARPPVIPTMFDDAGGPISATIADLGPAISVTALAAKFADHFLPICQASVDLLEADERDFEARCQRMLDCAGTAMIDELCAELQIVGRQMQLLVDGLDLAQARLRTAMARLCDTESTRGNG